MELTGSEYWTHFTQERVGRDVALELTGATRPITANQAHAIGMVDELLHYSPSSSFADEVKDQDLYTALYNRKPAFWAHATQGLHGRWRRWGWEGVTVFDYK